MKSDIIHKELELHQEVLNYQLTGLASSQLQYTKHQIQQLNNKCDKLYIAYCKQLECEKKQNINSNTGKNYIVAIYLIILVIIIVLIIVL